MLSSGLFGDQKLTFTEKENVYPPTENMHHNGQSSEERRQTAANITDVWQNRPVDLCYLSSDL